MSKLLIIAIFTSTLIGVTVAEEQISRLNEDSTCAISRSEATVLPYLYNNWESFDTNADGVIDQVEFSRFEAIRLIVLGIIVATDAVSAEIYSQLDEDGDGSINREEARAMPELKEQWTIIDINRDGLVDEAEFSRFEMLPSSNSEETE